MSVPDLWDVRELHALELSELRLQMQGTTPDCWNSRFRNFPAGNVAPDGDSFVLTCEDGAARRVAIEWHLSRIVVFRSAKETPLLQSNRRHSTASGCKPSAIRSLLPVLDGSVGFFSRESHLAERVSFVHCQNRWHSLSKPVSWSESALQDFVSSFVAGHKLINLIASSGKEQVPRAFLGLTRPLEYAILASLKWHGLLY